MPLEEWMKTISHREYRTRLEWLNRQWNNPSLVCHYLMMVGAEVRRVLSKKPNEIQLDDLRLKFGEEASVKEPKTPAGKQAKADRAKRGWLGAVGRVIHKVISREEAEAEAEAQVKSQEETNGRR